MIDGEEFIFLFVFVPAAGIDDNLGAGRNSRIGNADLAGGICHEVVICKIGELNEIQPLISCAAARCKAVCHKAAECKRRVSGLQADLAFMHACSRNDPEDTSVRRIGERRSVRFDLQIFFGASGRCFHIILICADPFEGPHGDVAVIGDEQSVLVVLLFRQHGQRKGVQCVFL